MRLKAEVLPVDQGRVFDGGVARMETGVHVMLAQSDPVKDEWGRAWRTGIRVYWCASVLTEHSVIPLGTGRPVSQTIAAYALNSPSPA